LNSANAPSLTGVTLNSATQYGRLVPISG
jgi:hypothetical protein